MDSAWMGWLKKLLAVAFAASVIWVIGWGYWYFKISTAIDALDSGAKREPVGKEPPFLIPQESASEIQDAGTRALPHLAKNLIPKRNVTYLLVTGEWVRKWLVDKDPTLHLRPFHLDDPPSDIEAKCDEHQDAWKRIGAPRHRGWMWWKAEELPPQLYPQNYIR